ncbi:MAG: glycosyltransferase family 2 protein, partial [Gemmatimonadaceae bacterium]
MALTQLMMANSITSLRAIARRDWRSFVEHQSVVDQVLRDDPAGFYPLQAFVTRDQYRHVIERIAKRRRLSESEVARVALDLARDGAARSGSDARQGHVGYYLIDRGLAELEEATDYRPSLGERGGRWVRRHPSVVFFGGMFALTAFAELALLWLGGPGTRALWPLVVFVALIPANDIAINVLNQLLTAFFSPRRLPKLDLQEHGIPVSARTVVVVPTLFPNVDAVHEALGHLEVQFLANREQNLHFAILSDFTDAESEHRVGDEDIVAAAVEGVKALNARYGADSAEAFSLFHRSRLWNPEQGVWMGWERKRGKLSAFNHYLRGGAPNAFSTIEGDISRLHEVRYVITLDSDTVLPPDTATALIGTIAHPLNVAHYDAESGRVVRGYGIIQPRVGVSLPSAYRSRFAAIHSGHPGVDPYTTAVSDVYQDLYGEGSFTGKGIYDVNAFELATHGRFPENTLLSHDLIEGNYARAGLATDVIVYDEYPSRYLTFTRRKHRWIRGDWQLLRWLTSHVPGPEGEEPNRLSPLSRWKIFDNLRRSTVELAQLLFLIAGWTILPGSPLRWTLLGLGAIAAPWIVSLILAILRPPLDKSWRAYYATVREDAETSALQLAQAIAFLPHQAYVSADAIVRTLYRVFVSHRHLLEWQTASQTEQSVSGNRRDIWRTMWPAVGIAVAIVAAATIQLLWRANFFPGGELAVTTLTPDEARRLWLLAFSLVPLAVLWTLSPVVALALSKPKVPDERRLPADHRATAFRYALLHWRFFERFVDASTNWLAPDNFQDDPSPVVAMRTSPTNIGLQLLSTVSAFELGFIPIDTMVDRLEHAFRSLERMARFRGHFFNWYELHDLRVLEPAYISTVDSGNLAGHLIALRQGCKAILDEPIFDARTWRALDAALTLANQELRAANAAGARSSSAAARPDALNELRVARAAVGALSHQSTRDGQGSEGAPSGHELTAAYEEAVVTALQRARSSLGELAGHSREGSPSTVASLGDDLLRVMDATVSTSGSATANASK